MNFETQRPVWDEKHVDALIEGMIVQPHDDKKRPSPETHLWLNMRAHFVWSVEEAAELDGSLLSQQGAAPRVFVPLTPELKEVLESTAIYKPASGDSYYLDLDKGGLTMRYQQIIGSRLLTPPSQDLDAKFRQAIADRMLSMENFTNPVIRFVSDPESRRHGAVVPNPSERVSARLEDKEATKARMREVFAEISKPAEPLPPAVRERPSSKRSSEKADKPVEVTSVDLSDSGASTPSSTQPERAKPSTRKSNASDSALADLGKLKVDDEFKNRLNLPSEHLEHYAEIKGLITKAGGVYNTKGHFAFPEGINVSMVHRSLMAGLVVNEKKDQQFFATPLTEATRLCDRAGDLQGKRVLEPSAGDGALADIARERGADVTVVENWPVNVAKLKAKGYNVIERDFLTLTPEEIGTFDVVLANPPFSRNQDIVHVEHMMKFLEPEGMLSVITSQAWQRGNQKKQVAFAEWLEEVGADVVPIEAGAFKESGTQVPSFMIALQAPELQLELDEQSSKDQTSQMSFGFSP